MFEGMRPGLELKKVILDEEKRARVYYNCRILAYDGEKECLYLVMEVGTLREILLDAVYECTIFEKEPVICEGVVMERYFSKEGRTLKFQIKNGFYHSIK